MKKLFSFIAALFISMSMFATKVTFDFSSASAYGYANPAAGAFTQVNNGDVLSKDGVTITVGFTSGNGVRFFANTNTGVINLREYVGSTLTIAAPAGSKINGINLDGTNLTSTYLSGDVTSKEWTGDATSVTINIIKSTVQINNMVVTLDETPGPLTVDTITVSQAKTRIDAGNLGKCYVYGRVVTIDASKIAQYSNLNCWFVDLVNTQDTLEGYKMNGANNTPYTSESDVEYAEGDTVLFYASALKKYNTTYEINEGYYVATLGAGDQHAQEVTLSFSNYSIQKKGVNLKLNLTGTDALAYTVEAKGDKAIAGVYTYSSSDILTLTHAGNAVTVASGTITLTYVSQDAANNYTYDVKINLVDAAGVVYKANFQATTNGNFEDDNTNIDVQMALTLCEETGTTATTTLYNVYGYVASIKTAYDQGYKNSSFYMTDVQGGTTGTFLVYRGKSDAPLNVGDKIVVKQTNLINYSGNTPETNNLPQCEVVTDFPVLRHGIAPVYDTIDVDVAGAMAVGEALADNAVTTDYYRVTGYAVKLQKDGYNTAGYQTIYMSDDATATNGDFEAYKCNVVAPGVAQGDLVEVIGKITKYVSEGYDPQIEIKSGDMRVISGTGVEQTISGEKAAKLFRNGKIVILRGNRQYNIDGKQL